VGGWVGGWVGGGERDRACVCAVISAKHARTHKHILSFSDSMCVSACLADTHIMWSYYLFLFHSFLFTLTHSSTHTRARAHTRTFFLSLPLFTPEGPSVGVFVRSESVTRESVFLSADFSISLSLSSATGSTGLQDTSLTCYCVCPCLCVGGTDVAAMVFQEVRKRLRRHFFQVRRLH
jgi:hypothetical protein